MQNNAGKPFILSVDQDRGSLFHHSYHILM